ncbi:MAG: hypothetical protein ACRCZE_01125 [Candidatus Altimarinota bacterium]
MSLTLFGCSPFNLPGNPKPTEEPTIYTEFSESFQLKIGQSAALPEADLIIFPTEVLEDSRCPSAPIEYAPDCYWSGQVRLLLQIKSDDTYIENLEVSDISPSNYQDFQIILEDVQPPSLVTKNSSGEILKVNIKPSDYQFTLKFEKL